MTQEPSEAISQKTSQNDERSTKTFEARLKRIMEACGAANDSELARVLNITPPSVGTAKKRLKIPSGWIEKISVKFGVSTDWLFFGTGLMRPGEAAVSPAEPQALTPKAEETPVAMRMGPARAGMLRAGDPLTTVVAQDRPQPLAGRTIEHDTGDIILVPMVEARLSAGTGSFETGDGQERFYAFRLDFLRRKGIPAQMALMRVSGDSMEPEIKDGDVVLIDQNQKTPTPGKLFAVGVEDMVYIKEVNAEPGKLVLSSYNKAYPALEIDARGDLEDGIRIIGRAVWVGRELK